MNVTNEQWRSLLVDTHIIPESSFTAAVQECSQNQTSLYQTLIQKNLISDLQLAQVLSVHFQLPFIDLSQQAIPQSVLEIIPEIVATKHRVICFKLDKDGVHLAIDDPADHPEIPLIEKKTGNKAKIHIASPTQINTALELYSQDLAEKFDSILASTIDEANSKHEAEPPIILIVDTLLDYALRNKSSDIHLEPYEHEAILRFRIDGILHDIAKIPIQLFPRIVSRIKVLSQLKTDEHLTAQDGKFRFTPKLLKDTTQIDVRTSIAPVTHGEKVVMRLLAEQSQHQSLQDLGLSNSDIEKIEKALSNPHGMILATGPTGSGKTTTLYVILKMLNQPDVNIMTIEDPVEYDMDRINQIQVNEKTGLSFAHGLRSIVRQDPDIIFIGEIRDSETASIAINSALTGHQVLSTLHTNDAATSLPRLLDMGIEPFLIASSVTIIIAQRLVRKICDQCVASHTVTQQDLKDQLDADSLKLLFDTNREIRLYAGKGCDVCHQTGYVGRVGIFEILEVTDKDREMIMARKDAAAISKRALEQGMTSMLEDGLNKVQRGITTIDEVLRTIHE